MYTGASCGTWISPRNALRCARSLALGILGVHNVGASGILHFWSGSEAHGRLDLTVDSPHPAGDGDAGPAV
eukprot:5580144-Pyramimonas_sp.AAC.1